jgi:tRNA-2-methylthio-N6-dimethylallyladenosine synthase
LTHTRTSARFRLEWIRPQMDEKSKGYLYLQNFGCQMNLHDSQRILEVLGSIGYLPTPDPNKANLILVNTCSVRAKSQAKVLSSMGRFRPLKEKKRDLILGVAGCVAQQEGAKLFEAMPYIDLVFGPDHIAQLPELLGQLKNERMCQVGFLEGETYRFLKASPGLGQRWATAFVTIQKGCDNHCSYCIVPTVRGPEVSRPGEEILDEIRDLVDTAGIKEVTLIGQNVNSYRGLDGTDMDFVELLRKVDRLAGLSRIRFTTSHPKDFSPSLGLCFKELEHLCPWLHLPVQAGSTSTLTRMNRGYNREDYLAIIQEVRSLCPEISIGTDIIVGFPGENESDFLQTVSLLEEIQYDYMYSFKYSVRPNTPAAALFDDVPEEEKSRRLSYIQSRQDAISRFKLAREVGKQKQVLVEGPSKKGLPQVFGRTPQNQIVNFEYPGEKPPIGRMVDVLIIAAGGHSLTGKVVHINS